MAAVSKEHGQPHWCTYKRGVVGCCSFCLFADSMQKGSIRIVVLFVGVWELVLKKKVAEEKNHRCFKCKNA